MNIESIIVGKDSKWLKDNFKKIPDDYKIQAGDIMLWAHHGTILPPVKGDKFHLFEFSVIGWGKYMYHIYDMEIGFSHHKGGTIILLAQRPDEPILWGGDGIMGRIITREEWKRKYGFIPLLYSGKNSTGQFINWAEDPFEEVKG